jgi:hypothetical protein
MVPSWRLNWKKNGALNQINLPGKDYSKNENE